MNDSSSGGSRGRGVLAKVLLVLVVFILLACSASAVLSIRAGRPERAASTFFAGLTMSILIGLQAKRRR